MAQPFKQLSLPADPKEPVPCALQRLSAEELAAALAADRAGGGNGRIVVVDARDADRADGHVAGARHVGSQTVFLRDEGPGGAVDQLAAELREASTVVLHCGKSVQRGPHAANRYEEARARLAAAGDTALAAQKVVLLEGGFAAFAACPAAAGLIAADADAARPK